MMMRNLGGRWGYVAKALHWSAAALIITMLGLGLAMVHDGLGSGAKFETYQLHKEIGFFVLAVMLVRGLWRMANSSPAFPAAMRPWERQLARAFHLGFYILIAAMIASGLLMVSASPLPFPTHLPGGFIVPNLTGPNALLEARSKLIHNIILSTKIGFCCACCLFIMMTIAHDDKPVRIGMPFLCIPNLKA